LLSNFKKKNNNHDLLKTIWKHKKRGKKKLIVTGNAKQCEAQVDIHIQFVSEIRMCVPSNSQPNK
jgi:hypothetical protein